MEPRFIIGRPQVSDEEIEKRKNFNRLVEEFKKQSIQKARQDRSWWRNKRVRYSTVIAGAAVVCTVTLLALQNLNHTKTKTNETLTTQSISTNKPAPAEKKSAPFINPPSRKLAIPYSAYKVSNAKGGEIRHPSSSRIRIPKNSFVDRQGKEIIGEVTIEYREFHDHSDLIAGGIPMAYDSAGKQYNLESAGMFDIRGSQNGEPVFIKPQTKLEVDLASHTAEDRFNQYFLDTTERNWQYLKRDKPLPPEEWTANKETATSAAAENSPKLQTLKRETEVILPRKIDSVEKVFVKKSESLPKAKEPLKPRKPSGRQAFNIDASPKDFPELSAFSNLLFEIGEENKNYSKEMNEITWNDVKISEGPQKGKNYLLTITQRNRVEKLIVYPVLSGADFEKAQKSYEQKFSEYQQLAARRGEQEAQLKNDLEAKRKAYEAEIEQKRQEYQRLREELASRAREARSSQAAMINSGMEVKARRIFEISRFGIYNSDCPRSAPEGKSIAPVFLANGNPLFPRNIYLVSHTQNSVYSFLPGSYEFIKIDPSAENSFVISVNERLYLCSKASFLESMAANSNKFKVVELPEELADIRKALQI